MRGVKKLFNFIDFHGHFLVKCRHEIKPVCEESWDQLQDCVEMVQSRHPGRLPNPHWNGRGA